MILNVWIWGQPLIFYDSFIDWFIVFMQCPLYTYILQGNNHRPQTKKTSRHHLQYSVMNAVEKVCLGCMRFKIGELNSVRWEESGKHFRWKNAWVESKTWLQFLDSTEQRYMHLENTLFKGIRASKDTTYLETLKENSMSWAKDACEGHCEWGGKQVPGKWWILSWKPWRVVEEFN